MKEGFYIDNEGDIAVGNDERLRWYRIDGSIVPKGSTLPYPELLRRLSTLEVVLEGLEELDEV